MVTRILLSIPKDLPFPKCELSGIRHLMAFGVWPLSLTIIPLEFIHVITCIAGCFPFPAEHYYMIWTECSLFNHSPAEGYCVFFWFLAIANKAAINIFVQVLGEHRFSFHLDKYLGVKLLCVFVS